MIHPRPCPDSPGVICPPFPAAAIIALVLIGFLISPCFLSRAQTPAESTGAALLKTDILAVFAHPDDETGMATTLAHYAHVEGRHVTNVYCTRGEGGGNMVGRQWGPSLGILREAELRNCLDELGVSRVCFLNQRDWAYTESARMTLESWDRDAALEALVRIIRTMRPEILLTMNPTPNPGQHGHHQAAGILAIEAFRHAADPDSYPLHLQDEGLQKWQIRKLYIGSSPEPYGATIPSTATLPDGRSIADISGKALSHHRSQGFGRMAGAPWMARPRTYQLIKSTVGFEPGETSLFDRLTDSRPPANADEVQSVFIPDKSQTPSARFLDRPAMERFHNWTRQEQVTVLHKFREAELSLPTAIPTIVPIILKNVPIDRNTRVEISAPDGWTAIALDEKWKGKGGTIPVAITPPASATQPGHIRATVHVDDNPPVTATATISPLPHFELRLSPKELSPQNIVWDKHLTIPISHTATWQGSAESDMDISAVTHWAADPQNLHIHAVVQDQTLVTNIAPNDVRGHWRSDSIEICLDPENGAEHTLNTFKVGIFPFTIGGPARAARDADANQGPIERTAPEMKISSTRTGDGYTITASIPWTHIGINPKNPQTIAFNFLIYDGDKSNASPGENINETRLAIATRSGVQGRPEDWARLTLNPPATN
jgi:LmbE family N-acetylglucosaminyl deacetylase